MTGLLCVGTMPARTGATSKGAKARRTLSSSPPVPGRSPAHVTELLVAWRAGSNSALDELVPLVETQLRQAARRHLRRERPGHVLQTTALMNEAFVRLLSWQSVTWANRAHFLALASRLMRHILIDMSRRRAKGVEGRTVRIVDLTAADHATHDRSRDLIALDDALR